MRNTNCLPVSEARPLVLWRYVKYVLFEIFNSVSEYGGGGDAASAAELTVRQGQTGPVVLSHSVVPL